MEQNALWEANSQSVRQEIPHLLWNRRFITLLTRARTAHYTDRDASIPQLSPISLIFIQRISSHPHLCLWSVLVNLSSATKISYTVLICHMRATRPAYLILSDLFTIMFCEACKLKSSSLCSFLFCPATSSLLHPNILLSAMFSYTLNRCSSLSFIGKISHPYKTGGNFFVLIFNVLKIIREGKISWPEWKQAFRDLNLLLIYSFT